MEIKTKKHFNDIMEELVSEIIEEEELEEINTTASVGGEYMTPMAFSDDEKKALKLVRSTAYGIAKMFNCKSATKAHRNADKTLNSLQISFFKNE